jgi:hypothetical protein
VRRSQFGHLRGALPLILLLIATISCASLESAPASTPATSTLTPTQPPVVQTADALSAAIATYIASIATAAPGWTATADFAAKATLVSRGGLTPPGKRTTPGTPTPTPVPGTATLTPTPPPSTYDTYTPSVPPAVQTAEALNALIQTYIASIPTNASGLQTKTAVPAMQTAEAQFATVKTLGASIGLIAPEKQIATATATPTPGPAGGGSVGGGGVSSGGGSNGGANGGSSGGGTSSGNGGSVSGGNGTPNSGGNSGSGAYVVKQTESLGGETISGFVCSRTAPFGVSARTSKVAWVFGFVPRDATHGQVTYAYSIPSAGEAHDATGTYTLSSAAADGTLLLSMAVSDHVTFKGFDGNIPLHYQFQLVPSESAPCP